MWFPREYPYKLRRVARKINKSKIYYSNSKNQRMICKQLVHDPRVIALINHFFAVSEHIKQTEIQKKEMQMILDKAKVNKEYANVFCLGQIRIHYTRYENKTYVLAKERLKMLHLIKNLNFKFFKLFTAEALSPIQEK